jgi:tetratricopeptide (TPR) repeat protein
MAKINRWLAPLAAIVGAAAWFQPSVAGSDLWWHLAAGREILETRSLPTVDHFSFTFAGRDWMHHEWLWGVGYWLAWEIDPQLVAWANLGLLVAVFAVAFEVARRHCGSSFAAGLALWGAAATSYWFLDIRPHELTLLFVGIVLLTRDKPWAPWLWPPLMVLWCNLHGGFVFGFGAIGLFALAETLRGSWAARRLSIDWRLWAGVALTGLAFLCNPWGWRILEYPAAYLDSSSPFREILEWQPPGFSLDPRGFAGRFTWLLAAAVAGAALELRSKRRDPYLVSLAAVTCAMALTSRRFIPLFAVTALPMLATLFTALRDAVAGRLPEALAGRVAAAAPLAALVLALALWRDVRLTPGLLERWTESQLYPRAALTYLRAVAPGPRLLNHYNWGGYVMLHAPEFKLLIDGRANTLYDDKTYLDYVALTRAGDGLAARLAQYPVDAALLPAGPGRLAEVLAGPRYGWRVIYSDGVATVLLPPGSPRLARLLPRPGDLLADDPDWLLLRGEAAAGEGNRAAARSLTEAAIERDPLLVRGYGQLADLYAQEGDAAGVAAAIERGIEVEPRSTQSFRQVEAYAWDRMGERERALAALEQAVPRGPFSRPEAVLSQIAARRRQPASR